MADRPEAITLADVADRAGVSKATASKALADRYGVSAQTRDRVLRVAAELNFAPNLLARGLGGGRTHTVGIVTTDVSGRFAPQIMAGVEDALGADRSSVIMCNTRGRADLEEHHVKELLRRFVDGLVVIGDDSESRAPIAVETTIPVVYAYAPSAEDADTSIVCDNVAAGGLAVSHLVEVGKRRLVCIGGDPTSSAARERAAGFAHGVAEAGLEPASELRFWNWSEQWGWDATGRLLDDGVAFDGLVCADDQVARGALDRLLSHGSAVPDDVAVIGFDNWPVISTYSRHPFSSIDMNLGEVGRAAAQQLLASGGPQPGIVGIAGRVAVRGSTRVDEARPPSGDPTQ